MDPGRVWKGKRMAGHYGDEQVTISNLKIVSIDAESHLVVIKGAIPGPNGGLVSIKQS
jgi:large subunit ribosomal protein L3